MERKWVQVFHSGHCGPAAATAAAGAAVHGTSDIKYIKFYDDQQLGSTHSGTSAVGSADRLLSPVRRKHQLHHAITTEQHLPNQSSF